MKKTLCFLLGALLLSMMPGNDAKAQYRVNWTGVNYNQDFTYSAMAVNIGATYRDAAYVTHNATLVFKNLADNTVSTTAPKNVGSYEAIARPILATETLIDTVRPFTISRAHLHIAFPNVQYIKWFDGTDTAHVINKGIMSGVQGFDDVSHITTARYNDAAEGSMKSIVAYYTLTGADTANYILDTTAFLTNDNNAYIIRQIVLDSAAADNGIFVDANGYCDNVQINYYLLSGNATKYKLDFDAAALAAGFQNVPWTNIPVRGQLTYAIPAGVQPGTYGVTISFANALFGTDATYGLEKQLSEYQFQINLSKDLTRAIFTDVISIVDTCNCFSNYQWYHNDAMIPDANLPYYQEVGGLTGYYHVLLSMNGNWVRTCPQANLAVITPSEGEPAFNATVSAYPNPTTDRFTVEIENSSEFTHTLQVMNVMGMVLVNTTFNGTTTTIDLSAFNHGNYTVTVDGIATRVIKK